MLNIPPESLPHQLQLIAEQCGHETAMMLLNYFGGIHLSIPAHPTPTHKLSDLLGWESFRQLCGMFGGEIVSVPKAQAAIRAARNKRIKAERRGGALLAEIARRHDLTERHIMVILKNA